MQGWVCMLLYVFIGSKCEMNTTGMSCITNLYIKGKNHKDKI